MWWKDKSVFSLAVKISLLAAILLAFIAIFSSCTTTHQVSHIYIVSPTHLFIADDSTCSPPKEIF